MWTGSHIDTVPNGGPLDGALGVVAALERVRRITEAGLDLARPVNAAVFADEEGNDSGRLLGSYGLSHGYSLADLESMTGRDGDRLLDALAKWSWADGSPTGTRLEPGTMHFVELHIEQGPRLDGSGDDIGVVTSIVGVCGATVSFLGRAGQAGTTPMTMRPDALRAATDFLNRLPVLATGTGPATVITCGRIAVAPSGTNLVPRLAELSLDFRDPRAATSSEHQFPRATLEIWRDIRPSWPHSPKLVISGSRGERRLSACSHRLVQSTQTLIVRWISKSTHRRRWTQEDGYGEEALAVGNLGGYLDSARAS